jgi:hypothetical protein
MSKRQRSDKSIVGTADAEEITAAVASEYPAAVATTASRAEVASTTSTSDESNEFFGRKRTAVSTSKSMDSNSVVEDENSGTSTTTSEGRWFELPADVDASQTALRPKYLPDGPCYERRPVTDLWQKMTNVTMKQWQWRTYKNNNSSLSTKELRNTPRRLLQVFGPPGSGKSTAAYAWMCNTCLMANCKAIWIECAQKVDAMGGTSKGWCLSRVGSKVNVTPGQWNGKPTLKELQDLGADIVIFDGMSQDTRNGWAEQFTSLCDEGVAVILVASEGFSLQQGTLRPIVEIKYRVPSWTLEEYYAACALDSFWENVSELVGGSATVSGEDRKMAIDNKYLIAGHSARFMFDSWSEDVRDAIYTASAKLGKIDTLRNALLSWANEQSVNQLMAWLWENGPTRPVQASFPTINDLTASISDLSLLKRAANEYMSSESQSRENVFVSKLALEKVLNRITKKVDQMRDIALDLNQPAVKGYALELRFLELLDNHTNKTDSGIEVFQSVTETEEWPVGHVVRQSTGSTLSEAIKGVGVDHRNNSWIWVGGNITGFDAVHIFTKNNEHCIRFVQITAAEEHSFKLYAVEAALGELASKGICFARVDFAFVRPTDDERKFYMKPAEGGLKSGNWKTLDGGLWREMNDPRKLAVVCAVKW